MNSLIRQTLFVCLSFFLLNSCQQAENDMQQRMQRQHLSVNMHSEPPTLDSRLAADTTSSFVLRLLFEGLTRIGPDRKPHPAAAESIEVSEDKLSYTFVLRNADWSNGDPITAHDFAEAWRYVLDPVTPADYAYQLYILKNGKLAKEGKVSIDEVGIRVVNDRTLLVQLEHPAPYFLELLTHTTFLPIHHRIAEKNERWSHNAGEDFVSNGPFTLEEWRHSDEITLKKNPHYWDESVVHLNTITISMIDDVNTELSLYDSGDLDWAGTPISLGLPNEAIPMLREEGRLQTAPISATYFYVFNCEKVPFNNEKIRRAFSLAINRRAIVDNVTLAGQEPALSFVPASMHLKDEDYFPDSAVQMAKKLFHEGLEELGITVDQIPPINLSYNTSEGHQKVAQAIQQQWRRAFNIQVGLENFEWKVYLDKLVKRDYQVGRLGWIADYHDPINFLEAYQYHDNPMNHSGWEDPNFSHLLTLAEQERDEQARFDYLSQAEEVFIDAMPIAPIYHNTNSFLKREELKDVIFSSVGSVDFKWARFEPNTSSL